MESRNRLFRVLVFCYLSSSTIGHAQNYDQVREQLTRDVIAAIEKSGCRKVATVDFHDLRGVVSELGRFLSEEVSIGLVMKETSFVVLDRGNLTRIMAEHKLTMSGLLDPKNAKKLGQFSGADALITGTITDVGNEVLLFIKVISTETAEVVGAARARIPKSQQIQGLLDKQLAAGPKEGNSDQNIPEAPSPTKAEREPDRVPPRPPTVLADSSPPRRGEELVGRLAPEFSAPTIGGKGISSKDFGKHRGTVLNFVAPNCGFCKRQVPRVEKARIEFESKGVRFINVAQTMRRIYTNEEIYWTFKDLGSNMEVATDTDNAMGRQYGVTGYPTLIVVDSHGTVSAVIVGNVSDLEGRLRGALAGLVK